MGIAAIIALTYATESPARDTACAIPDSIIRQQADSFLLTMPRKLQSRQARAVKKAISGNGTELAEVRTARDRFPAISAGVHVRELSPCLRLYEPDETEERQMPLLIYLHGGGWTFGSVNSCGRFCDALAATGKMKVLAVNYRLAPEHPYPCGYHDCIGAVEYAVARSRELGIDTCRISIGGDSSGGNLAIATALSPECRGSIESLVVFYPVTKAFDDRSASWKAFRRGYALDASLMKQFNRAYTSRIPSETWQIDVGLAPDSVLEHLPRTLLVAAGRDILRDQGEEFARRVPRGRIQRIEFPGAVHLFITVPGQEAAFRSSVVLTARFLSETPATSDNSSQDTCKKQPSTEPVLRH